MTSPPLPVRGSRYRIRRFEQTLGVDGRRPTYRYRCPCSAPNSSHRSKSTNHPLHRNPGNRDRRRPSDRRNRCPAHPSSWTPSRAADRNPPGSCTDLRPDRNDHPRRTERDNRSGSCRHPRRPHRRRHRSSTTFRRRSACRCKTNRPYCTRHRRTTPDSAHRRHHSRIGRRACRPARRCSRLDRRHSPPRRPLRTGRYHTRHRSAHR